MRNPLNLLLVLIPVAVIGRLLHWPALAIFVISGLAIVPLAKWMGTATEELAVHVGPGGVFTDSLVQKKKNAGEPQTFITNSKNRIVATAILATGRMVENALGIPVRQYLSGPIGGDQQVGALIAECKVDVLIFFWDPLSAQPHDPDVKALLRLAVVWNIPVANNRITADHLFGSPLMGQTYERAVPVVASASVWPRV